MDAGTLNCPMCGAATTSDASRCEHCQSRLATVACPACFGRVFVGEKFCSHCGALATRDADDGADPWACPRCPTGLTAVAVGPTHLHECPKCEGIWLNSAALERICTDHDQQATLLGKILPAPTTGAPGTEDNIRYIPCPVCHDLMNRLNFGKCSHVIVDVCKPHGTWFDRDELRLVVEFLRSSGLERARTEQEAEHRRHQHFLDSSPLPSLDETPWYQQHSRLSDWSCVLSIASDLAAFFLRR